MQKCSEKSGEAHSENQTFRYMPYCKLYLKIAVSDFGKKDKYVSKSIPLGGLLKTHLGVEVDPQDGKFSHVCAKCTLKIHSVSTLCEFINDKSAFDESDDQECFKRILIMLFGPIEMLKKSLLQFAIDLKAVQRHARTDGERWLVRYVSHAFNASELLLSN